MRRGAIVSLSLNGFAADGVTSAALICRGPAGAGFLTIPAGLLSPFGAGTLGSLDVRVLSNGLIPQHELLRTKDGKTLVVFLAYSTDDRRPVEFQ